MSYFTAEQHKALEVKPNELRQLQPSERLDYAFREMEIVTQRRAAFWDAVSAFAVSTTPILALFGISTLVKRR